MPTIQLNHNTSLFYREENPGGQKAVLLLHGLGVDSSSWQLQIPPLVEAGFRILAPDGRGFGRSTYAGDGMGVAQCAGDFAALLRTLQTGPVHVVGISMGGTHALQLALDHPELVDRLVLVNTFARIRPVSLSAWVYFASHFIPVHTFRIPAQARLVAQHLFPHPDQETLRQMTIAQVTQANPRAYRAAMRALARFDVLKRLGEIKAPTLVITGADDSTVRPEVQAELVKYIPHARQVILDHAGHAVIIDQAESFNRVVINFLKQGK